MDDGPKRRACIRCRNTKTRCLIDESRPTICQRCARLGHSCSFPPIEKREPRKATHTRVEELERNISALQAVLREKSVDVDSNVTSISNAVKETTNPASSIGEHEPLATPAHSSRNLHVYSDESLWSQTTITHASRDQQDKNAVHPQNNIPTRLDPIDEGLLSMQTARRLLQIFKAECHPHYPVVNLHYNLTADELRETKPMLFLAVLAAAAGQASPDLAARLDKKVLEEYAMRCMIDCEKSLELVQSLLVSAIWFQLPKRLNQLKFNDYIRMAGGMAMDIGIGTSRLTRTASNAPVEVHGQHSHPLGDRSRDPNISIHNLETDAAIAGVDSTRALLGIFVSSANISITLRRPAAMLVGHHIHEAIKRLEEHSSSTNRELIAWTRLSMVSDEIGMSFSYHDPNPIASILDIKTQLMLATLEEKLSRWRGDTFRTNTPSSLRIAYNAVRLYLFEIVLHLDFPSEDFKAPFQMSEVIPSTQVIQLPMKPIVGAIAKLIQSSHALLDVFLRMSTESIKALPVFCLIRVSSALFILAKLSMICTSNHSRLRTLTNEPDIRLDHYMDSVLRHLRKMMGPEGGRTPAMLITLLSYIRQRCSRHQPAKPSQPQRSPNDLGQLLPGIVAHSQVTSPSGGNIARTASVEEVTTTPSEGSYESPWSVPMDDVNWHGNVLSFPGDGLPLGHNDQSNLMSCPTQ